MTRILCRLGIHAWQYRSFPDIHACRRCGIRTEDA